ncbi:MAG TPA: hypothetical protein VGG14_18475 [Candidatus Sulfotelmatobacter sp.]|jgi:hypothetical protein
MRCLSAIAVFLLVAALPLSAQRGGGHASGGSHGGFSGHAGGFSGGHSFGGFHSGSSFAPRSFSRGFSRGPIASRGFSRGFNNRGFNRGGTRFHIGAYGFRNNCYGYNCGYGYGYPYLGGGIDPYWWWDNDSDNGYDPSAPYNYDDGMANQMYQQGIPMRPPQSDDQNSSAHSAPQPQQQPERTELSTPTVLIFRDQHREEVQNYAIVGETLWTFAPQKTRKISLDDIDIPATQKANDERGLDFRVPGA